MGELNEVFQRALMGKSFYIAHIVESLIVTVFWLCRVAACLVSLVWATFGMKSPEDFESKHKPETIIGKFLLGLWLLMSVVVLVNMLIAIITTSFQSVQVTLQISHSLFSLSFVRPTVCLSVCLSVDMHVFLSVCPFIHPIICLSTCQRPDSINQ